MTEVKTNSQTITRTIRFDYSGVEQYMKPGVDYPKEKTQTVVVMQQGVKGTNGQLNWGQWSVGTFPKIELSALSGGLTRQQSWFPSILLVRQSLTFPSKT